MNAAEVKDWAALVAQDINSNPDADLSAVVDSLLVETVIDVIDGRPLQRAVAKVLCEYPWPKGATVGLKKYFNLAY